MKALSISPLVLATSVCFSATVFAQTPSLNIDAVFGPLDNNQVGNPAIQPDPANDPDPDGNIPDQTMQFGEVMRGELDDADFMYGGLGTDILLGGRGNDVIMGGPEHFNPLNRDRAFGEGGFDVFVWQPGDGSDRFEGKNGEDAVVFALIAQDDDGDRQLFDPTDAIDPDSGAPLPNFRVRRDQQAGLVLMRDGEFLPLVDVSASPGFCEVLDSNTIIPNVADTAAAFDALDVDHLIRFRLRNGNLAVTIQVTEVENVVCGGPEAGTVEVFDLTVSPPQSVILDTTDVIDLPNAFINPLLELRLNQLLVDSQTEILNGNIELGITVEDF